MAKQYPENHNGIMNICNAINFMKTNNDFHALCDTSQFELFIPDTYYIINKDISKIKNIIKLINIDCLKKRMLDGLEHYQNINSSTASSDVESV